LFPPAEGYSICSQWVIPGTRRSIDYVVTFPIDGGQRPLLLLEIKAASHFHLRSRRQAAIVQLTDRLDEVGPTNQHTDRLYAISAIGKRWRACYASNGHGSAGGRAVGDIAERTSLRSESPECWNPDITSDASWVALQQIVNTINGFVALINGIGAP
jgi:hypothetical protein